MAVNGHWEQIPAFPEKLEVRIRGNSGTMQVWVEDPPTSDPEEHTLDILEASVNVLPTWRISRHGGDVVRLADVLTLIRRYRDKET